jgi:hypothetical protein
MINVTRLNEVHNSLLKKYTQGYSPQQTLALLWYPGPNTLPAQQRT